MIASPQDHRVVWSWEISPGQNRSVEGGIQLWNGHVGDAAIQISETGCYSKTWAIGVEFSYFFCKYPKYHIMAFSP